MPSKRQIDANRRNAKKSTGPKTAEGKAVSRFNATRHGFTAKHNTLPFENNAEFHAVRDEFLGEHQPATPTELVQVEQMVTAFWRLRRIRATETAFLDREMERNRADAKHRYGDPGSFDVLAYTYYRNDSDPGTLANLSRYEARLERSFYKALRELQRLKALRPQAQPEPQQPAKERVPAPAQCPESGLASIVQIVSKDSLPGGGAPPPQPLPGDPPRAPSQVARASLAGLDYIG
jgi:hypothetical protein